MAEFFNDKQDVIDFELTDWGRYLLTRGKFKPAKYAFFDDGVLYDSEWAGNVNENQKEIQDRILNKTPRIKTVTNIRESKSYLREYNNASATDIPEYANPLDSLTNTTLVDQIVKSKYLYEQDAIERNLLLHNRLGSSKINSQTAPSFNLRFLKNEISSSVEYLSTDYGILNIPQINVDLEYKITIGNDLTDVVAIEEDVSLRSESFPDGTFFAVESDYLALDIIEENTSYEHENFTIEVFEIEDADTLQYKSLKILPKQDNIDKEGYLIDPPNLVSMSIPEFEENDLGYYFNLKADSEIEEELLCSLVENLKNKGHNLKLEYDLNCKELLKEANLDIYNQEGVEIKNCPEGE
tara:strand:+ start:4024 stop:5082 length:1059 start_codon:yes stop_codon:yes gene_type:complete